MSTATIINGVLPRERSRVHWVPYYVSFIAFCGLFVAINAFVRYDHSWGVLALFAIAAVIAELTSVQLSNSSHGRISIVAVITIASIVVLGPWGSALTGLASGLATIITTSDWYSQDARTQTHTNWWRRSAFNMSMRVLAALCGGFVFIWTGGLPGSELTLWAIPSIFFAVIVNEVIGAYLFTTVVSLQTSRSLLDILRQEWGWSYLIALAGGVIGGGGIAFAYETVGIIGLGIFMLPIMATSYAFHLYVNQTRSYVDQLESVNHHLEDANLGLLQTLAAVVDAYDIYTFGHSAQVARYAQAIAKAMGLPKAEQTKIYRGGLIHDIGKIGVTDAIIGKEGKLSDEEFEALKLHTVIGAEIVSQMPQFQELIPLVHHHHERWDGRGYPNRLKGDEATLGARIICVADSVEAMLSDRPYQATRSLASVIDEVIRCSGTQFDPQVVDAFLEVARNHGDEFFINSASKIAYDLDRNGALDTLDGFCYAKKSMIARHLQKQAINTQLSS